MDDTDDREADADAVDDFEGLGETPAVFDPETLRLLTDIEGDTRVEVVMLKDADTALDKLAVADLDGTAVILAETDG